VTESLSRFLVIREKGRLLGCVGNEIRGTGCVVRSLAVAPEARGRHLGRQLIAAAIDGAREAGCTDLYGLTNTAGRMLGHLGFSVISRDQVPEAVRASSEFGISACSAAAVLHRRV